ncbi:MAG TPA: acyltransferase family protein [Nocardioides sp.]
MRRDPWLDNAKFTLVTLVVIGHSFAILGASALELQVYDFIYFWHIPAFVLVSGHLSKGFAWDRKHFSSLFTTLVLPFLIFEPVLLAWREHLGEDTEGPLWLEPHWAMWYIVALFAWRLATPLLRLHWLMVPASVAVSLASGFSDVLTLSLPRILGLLPFFVIGLHLRREHLSVLTRARVRPFAAAAMLWIFVVAGSTDQWGRTAFLYHDRSYGALGVPGPEAMEVRLQVLLIGLVGAAAALSLIPSRQLPITAMGSASMVVYLFHGFVVRYAESAGWLDPWRGQSSLSIPLAVGGSVLLALFLSWAPVASRLTWFVDPVGSLRRRRASEAGASHPGPAPRGELVVNVDVDGIRPSRDLTSVGTTTRDLTSAAGPR